jgi:hypothetical protein
MYKCGQSLTLTQNVRCFIPCSALPTQRTIFLHLYVAMFSPGVKPTSKVCNHPGLLSINGQ